MPARVLDFSLLVLVLVAMIAGGLGGAMAYMFAYLVVGAVVGLVAALVGVMYAGIEQTEQILTVSLVAGSAGSALLAAGNLSLRFILKQLGVEVVVNISDKRKD